MHRTMRHMLEILVHKSKPFYREEQVMTRDEFKTQPHYRIVYNSDF